MSTTFTIDLDVSRAIAAQQQLISKFEDIAKAGPKIGQALNPLKEGLEKTQTSIENVGKALGTISSSSRLSAMVKNAAEINAEYEKVYSSLVKLGSYVPKELLGKPFANDIAIANEQLKLMQNAFNTIASQLQSLPKHKFDFSSVEEYRLKLSHLGQELAALNAFKPSLNAIDFKNMEASLLDAIAKYKKGLDDMVNGTQAHIKNLVNEFRTLPKDMDLILKSTQNSFSSGMTSGMGKFIDNGTIVTTKEYAAALTEANRAQMSFYEGMVKLGNYRGASHVKQSASLPTASTWSAAYIDPNVISGQVHTLETNISSAFSRIPTIVQAGGQVTITAFDNFYQNLRSALDKTNNLLKTPISGGEISKDMFRVESQIAAAFQGIPISAAENTAKTQTIFERFSAYLKNMFSSSSVSTSGVSTGIANIGNAAGAAESKLSGLGLVIKRVFEYGLVYRFQNALLSIPGALWDATTAVEKLKTSYNGMFGEGGENEFKYAMDSAQKYGKSIESVAESYKKFATTAEFVGMTQDQTKKAFESVNQAMVKSGNGSEQIKGAFLALEQMLNKGVVSAEEYRRQFAQYIPGAMKMGADSVGKTTAEFMKMMKTGELISLEFVPNLMDQLAKFGEGWEKMASTIEANSERLKNSFTMLGSNIFTALFTESDIKNVQKNTQNLVDAINAVLEKNKPKAEEQGWVANILEGFGASSGSYTKEALAVGTKHHEDNIQKAAFDKDQYWVQYKDGIANVKAQLDELMKTPGDISPESAKNIRMVSEQLYIGIDLVHKLCDPNWTVNVAANVDTSQITYAMGLINKLYAASKFGKTEDAAKNVKDIEAEQGKMKQLMGDLDTKMNAPDTSFRDRETLYAKKTKVQDDLAKSTIALTAAMGTYNDVLKAGSKIEDKSPFPTPPTNSGETKAKQIEAAKKHTQDMKKEAIRAYEADQGETGLKKISKAQLDENLKGWDDYLTGRIAQINKQGGGGGKSAERAAIASEHYEESLDNLLKKEYALANENPLDAAFASNAEKANSLAKQAELIATRTGSTLGEVQSKIAEFKNLADDVSIGKELEKLFPWMKKDNEIKAVFTMLGPKLEETKKHLAAFGIAGEDVVPMLENVAKAMAKTTEEAALLAKANAATNFADYVNNASALETSKNSSGGSGERSAIKELGDFFITTSKQMQESRIEMYKRIAEQAKTYGMDAAQAEAFVRAKMEETEVQRLENLQKYGTASEAFAARLSQNYGLYKSAETKARESSVAMADSITNATDSMASGIGQGIGDIIRNIGNGTASIEDLWKGMLSRMLDAFASFLEDLITSKLKEMFGNLAGSLLSGGDSGSGFSLGDIFGGSSSKSGGSGFSFSDLFSSSSNNTSATGVNYITTGSSNSGGSISDLISGGVSKGITSLFSSGTTSAASSLASVGLTSGITEAATGAVVPWATETAATSMSAGVIPTMTEAMAPSILGTGLETAGTASLSAGALSAGAMSGAATMGIGLVVGGLIAAFSSGMFDSKEKEPTKTAEGYNVAYKGGHAAAYGVDFYSDGSVQYSGASDPDVQKKIADSFKDTAENLSDFAEELGFVIDVLDTFEFPNMNITDDQLDGYIRNGQNQMAFQGLMEAGLRGAFDAVLEDGEVYVDAVERLATAYKSVVGSFEGYGYEMEDVAQISQEQIDALRAKNTEVAEGTAQALATMAAAMGAASDFVTQVASDTSIATAALSVTDEQLQNILEADYASKLLDAVGGEDAFKSIMENLTKNIFDTIDAYAENLDYYNSKAADSIAKLGDSSITIENFWEKFDAAIKSGLTVDQFEAWGKASEWVNQIDTVTDAIDDWNQSMSNMKGSLESRKYEALGMTDQAKYIQMVSEAENELYEARKNNYDEAVIAKMEEVQALEQERALYEIAKKQIQATQDINVREMDVTGNPFSDVIQAYYDNGWELQEAMESGLYSDADIARLADIQAKEIEKLWEEVTDAMTDAATSAHSRLLQALGKTDAAEMYDFYNSAEKELKDALDSGLYTVEAYSDLMRAIAIEAYNLEVKQARERKKNYTDAFVIGPLELEQQKNQLALTMLENQISAAETVKVLLDGTYQSIESAYNTMNSLAESLRDTLQSFRWNDNLSPNTATQTFNEKSSYYSELLNKVNTTDKSDMDYSKNIQNLSSFAGTYLESARSYFGASAEYWKIYEDVTGQLSKLQIDTQTDSDIYREQLLAQKSIANNSQAMIDRLTLANTTISEQLSMLQYIQAMDDLFYKQEEVARNITTEQVSQIYAELSMQSARIAHQFDVESARYSETSSVATERFNSMQATYAAMSAQTKAESDAQLWATGDNTFIMSGAFADLVSRSSVYSANEIKEYEQTRNDLLKASNVQVGKLDLQSQIFTLAYKNAEYQAQLMAAQLSVGSASNINEQMLVSLAQVQADYSAYIASLTENNALADSYYSTETIRILTGIYNVTQASSSANVGMWTLTNNINNYAAGIYNTLLSIDGKIEDGSTSTTSPYLGGFASGGEVSGPGWFMAGENGPEPVLLKGGSAKVTSNEDFTGSIDNNTKVSAAGFSALLAEMKAMRAELAQIRSTGQRAVAAPARR